MHYVAFFGILVPFQLFVVVVPLLLIRRRTQGAEAGSWLVLTRNVFLLMVIVNVLSLLPVVGLAAIVIWVVALKRLSGLDVLNTLLLAFILGWINFAAMLALAYFLEVSLGGQQVG